LRYKHKYKYRLLSLSSLLHHHNRAEKPLV
jgi:hypothetical protein